MEIRIDELVLRGARPEDVGRLRRDVEERLTELARGTDPGTLRPTRTDLARPRVAAPTADAPVGRAVADGIWAAVTGNGPDGSRP